MYWFAGSIGTRQKKKQKQKKESADSFFFVGQRGFVRPDWG